MKESRWKSPCRSTARCAASWKCPPALTREGAQEYFLALEDVQKLVAGRGSPQAGLRARPSGEHRAVMLSSAVGGFGGRNSFVGLQPSRPAGIHYFRKDAETGGTFYEKKAKTRPGGGDSLHGAVWDTAGLAGSVRRAAHRPSEFQRGSGYPEQRRQAMLRQNPGLL